MISTINRLFSAWFALAALHTAWGADTVTGALAENQLRAAATPEQFNQRMAWWHEARFGMFIHWGLYAIPAGVWKGQDVKIRATRTRLFFNIPTTEWDPLIQQFDLPWYNSRHWE